MQLQHHPPSLPLPLSVLSCVQGPVYYNISRSALDPHSAQSRADEVHIVATPPPTQKGPPPAVKPKPVQSKSMVSGPAGVMQHQAEVMQHEAMVSQQHPGGDAVEYANFGSVLATKSVHTPTEVTSSVNVRHAVATSNHSAVTSIPSPWQPTSQHSMKAASLPRQQTNHQSVGTVSPQTFAHSKSLLATPLVAVARDKK